MSREIPTGTISPRGLLQGWKRLAACAGDAAGGVAAAVCGWNRFEPFSPELARRVLAIRLDHAGDVVMTSAFLGSLKKVLPAAEIDVLVKPACACLLQHHPGVARIVPFAAGWTARAGEDSSGAVGACFSGYDLVFSLRGDCRDNLLAWRSGAKWRAGYAVRGGGFLLTHAATFDTSRHQIRRDLALLECLGFANPPESPRRIFLTETELAQGAELISACSGGCGSRKLIVIHPGAASPLKRAPVALLGQTARLLMEKSFPVAVAAGPGEEGLAEAIAVQSGACNLSRPGLTRLEFRTLAAAFAHVGAVVCNDSGPMHLAIGVGTPVAVLFGPTLDELTGPLSGEGTVICAPAAKRVKWFPGFPPPSEEMCKKCYEEISPKLLADTAISLLR